MKLAAKLSLAFAVGLAFLLVAGSAGLYFLEQLPPVLAHLRRQDRNLVHWREAISQVRARPQESTVHLRWPEDFLDQHGQDDQARQWAREARVLLQQGQVAAALERFERLQQAAGAQLAAGHARLAILHRRATWTAILLFAEAALLFGVLVFRLRRWISAPLGATQLQATNLAAGRFDEPPGTTGPGEFGEIRDALLQTAGQLQALRQQVAELEPMAQLGTACSRLTGNLRTALGSIRTLAQYEGTAQNMDPNAKLAFHHIVATVNKLDAWIRDLHTSLSPNGLHPVRQAVEPVLHDALALVQPAVLDKQLRIQLQPADELPEVAIDRIAIEQALVAVLSNAIEASPDSGELLVRTAATPDHALVQVSDHGRGMNAATRQHAFEAFFTTKPHSSGLGLTIAQAVVRRHGGDITLDNPGDGGTTVTISLPAVAVPLPPGAA